MKNIFYDLTEGATLGTLLSTGMASIWPEAIQALLLLLLLSPGLLRSFSQTDSYGKNFQKVNNMADFKPYYPKLLVYEGGYASKAYADRMGDSGGRTYLGIAENYNPKWEGWPLIDAWIKVHGEPVYNGKINSPEIYAAAEKLTKQKYWDKLSLDQVKNQSLAEQICDFGFNSGLGLCAKIVQRIIGMPQTAVLNSNDIGTINLFDQQALFFGLQNFRVEMIKNSTKINSKFKLGLTNRARSFIFQI